MEDDQNLKLVSAHPQISFWLDFLLQSGRASQWRVCYQRGLVSHILYMITEKHSKILA